MDLGRARSVQVSYEEIDDEEFESPLKKQVAKKRVIESDDDEEEEEEEMAAKGNNLALAEASLPAGKKRESNAASRRTKFKRLQRFVAAG